ncbi:MAG: SH3 domain-containing protein [Myxococcota bacterium]
MTSEPSGTPRACWRASAFAAVAIAASAALGCAIVAEKAQSTWAGLPSWRAAGGRTAAAEARSPIAIDRKTQLELEVEALRADLREAEAAMDATERGLRGDSGRADAVSILAEARIEIERASRNVPWNRGEVDRAQEKLAEAERKLESGQIGSAVFFASRARQIAVGLNHVATRVANTPGTRFVRGRRVNVRSGPSTDERVLHVLVHATPVFPVRREGDWYLIQMISGRVGWIHASLLRDGWADPSDATTQSLPASLAR